MKKVLFSSLRLFVAFFTIFYFFANEIQAQSCTQLDIIFNEPECFRPKSPDAGQGNGKNCKTASACVSTQYQYTSSVTGVGYIYNWSVTGPAVAIPVPNNAAATFIVFPVVGDYTITLLVTDNSSNTSSTCLSVSVKPKPLANFSFGPNGSCPNSPVYFTNTSTNASGGMVYSWNFGDPASGSDNFSTLENPNHEFSTSGTFNVCLIASSYVMESVTNIQGQGLETVVKICCSDTICIPVKISPGNLTLDCVSTVCPRQKVTYTANGCTNVTWNSVTGGTILSSNGNQITIEWGSGAVQGTIVATCLGGCKTQINVPIIPSNAIPVGDLTPCSNETTSYSLPILPGSIYTWQLTNLTTMANNTASIFTYPDNNVANINWNSISFSPGDVFQLSVLIDNKHICCTGSGRINITPSGNLTIFSNSPICAGSSISFFAGSGLGTLNWTVSPSAGVVPASGTGSPYTATFNNPGTYTITVNETTNAYCNNTAKATLVVLPVTPSVGVINGPVNVCIGTNYNYSVATPAPAGYHYTWTMSGVGGSFQPGNLSTVTGDNVTVKWTALPETFTVLLERNTTPTCPSAAVSVTANPATVGTITGTMAVCVDGNGSYSLSGTYPPSEPVTWSILPASAGTIIAGQGTGSITVLWHGQSGAGPWNASISATTGCGNPPNLTGIVVSPKFSFTLSQTNDICSVGGAVLTPSSTPAGSSYLWSNGATTATTSVTMGGSYTLTATKGGCSYSRSITVTDPIKFRILQCGAGFCNAITGQTNEVLGVEVIAPAAGVTLQWYSGIYPSGTAIAGQTGTSFTAPNFGDYYVTLTYGTCVRYGAFNVKKVCCPDVNIPAITSVVQNSCTNFTFIGTYSNPTGAAVTWYFDNVAVAAPASGMPISFTFNGAGVHCAKICVGAPTPNPTNCTGNCAATSIVVPIDAEFTWTMSCNGKLTTTNTSLLFPAPGATLSYSWDYGDGSPIVTGFSPTPHQYPVSGGTYVATLTINYTAGAITCSDSYSQTVTHTPLAINITPTPVCTGTPVLFSSTPAGFDTYSWTFGDGTFAFTPSTTHIYTTAAASNTASLSVTDLLGNVCTAKQSFAILASPTGCTIIDAAICDTNPAVLIGPAGGVSYQWQVFSGAVWVNAPGINNLQNYSTSIVGKYRVITYNASGCGCVSNSADVLNPPKPIAKIQVSPSTKLCTPIPPGPFSLVSTNHLSGYTSAWYVGSIGGTPVSTSPNYFLLPPAVTTNYFLVLTNEYGCTSQCNVVVEVNAPPAAPTITTVPSAPLCEGQSITLTASPAGNITWNTGQITPTITVSASGTYKATRTNTTTGCKSSAFVVVNPNPKVDLFPHFCDSIPCTCSRPVTLYGPKPLVGPLATTVNIEWYDAVTNSLLFTGQDFNNLPLGVQTGSYYIIATNPITGCFAKSESYSVEVPSCIDCSCDGSRFTTLTYTNGGGTVKNIECGLTYDINCNEKLTIDGTFICQPDECESDITYQLTFPNGVVNTGTLPFLFNPTTSGNYTLMFIGYCKGVACNRCEIKFNVTCNPLDVNLLDFNAKLNQNHVKINWSTTAEKNNQYFLLTKASSNLVFETIQKVTGKGNFDGKSNYSFIDEKPYSGVNYYQLKAVDGAGKITNSKIISVKNDKVNQSKIVPNPVGNILNLMYYADNEVLAEVVIYEASGRKLQSGTYKFNKGENLIQIPIATLPKGKFWMRGVKNGEVLFNLDFIK